MTFFILNDYSICWWKSFISWIGKSEHLGKSLIYMEIWAFNSKFLSILTQQVWSLKNLHDRLHLFIWVLSNLRIFSKDFFLFYSKNWMMFYDSSGFITFYYQIFMFYQIFTFYQIFWSIFLKTTKSFCPNLFFNS